MSAHEQARDDKMMQVLKVAAQFRDILTGCTEHRRVFGAPYCRHHEVGQTENTIDSRVNYVQKSFLSP